MHDLSAAQFVFQSVEDEEEAAFRDAEFSTQWRIAQGLRY